MSSSLPSDSSLVGVPRTPTNEDSVVAASSAHVLATCSDFKNEEDHEWSRMQELVCIDRSYIEDTSTDKSCSQGKWGPESSSEHSRLDDSLSQEANESPRSQICSEESDGSDPSTELEWEGNMEQDCEEADQEQNAKKWRKIRKRRSRTYAKKQSALKNGRKPINRTKAKEELGKILKKRQRLVLQDFNKGFELPA